MICSGILPDYMHIVHLACTGDTLTSILAELSDTEWPWGRGSRDARLEHAWRSYKCYCQRYNIADRCDRKTFTSEAVRGDYATLSQKFMRAAAARYVVFWLEWYLGGLLRNMPHPGPEDYMQILT